MVGGGGGDLARLVRGTQCVEDMQIWEGLGQPQ